MHNQQPDLFADDKPKTTLTFGEPVVPLDFDGVDYQPKRDRKRLTGQIQRIYDLIKDGQYRTLDQIAYDAECPHASASAQLRNLRKPRFGGYVIDRKHMGNGLYTYRLRV